MLGRAGHSIVVLDNLPTGFRSTVLYGDLIVSDTGDQELVSNILETHNIDSVMHFAAFTIVPESVADPLKYYSNNTCCTRNLIECCVNHKVKNLIFSSTASVYGIPDNGECDEENITSPINPYGTSELMSEWMLRDVCAQSEMNYTTLRHFNVAGSDPDGEIGQSTRDAAH